MWLLCEANGLERLGAVCLCHRLIGDVHHVEK